MDASELHARRLNAEVITPQNGETFVFPIADGKVKLSGGDQVLRTSTLSRRVSTTTRLIATGRFQETSCTAITLNQESNSTCREKSHSQFHCDTYKDDLGCIGCVDGFHTVHHIE